MKMYYPGENRSVVSFKGPLVCTQQNVRHYFSSTCVCVSPALIGHMLFCLEVFCVTYLHHYVTGSKAGHPTSFLRSFERYIREEKTQKTQEGTFKNDTVFGFDEMKLWFGLVTAVL